MVCKVCEAALLRGSFLFAGRGKQWKPEKPVQETGRFLPVFSPAAREYFYNKGRGGVFPSWKIKLIENGEINEIYT